VSARVPGGGAHGVCVRIAVFCEVEPDGAWSRLANRSDAGSAGNVVAPVRDVLLRPRSKQYVRGVGCAAEPRPTRSRIALPGSKV